MGGLSVIQIVAAGTGKATFKSSHFIPRSSTSESPSFFFLSTNLLLTFSFHMAFHSPRSLHVASASESMNLEGNHINFMTIGF